MAVPPLLAGRIHYTAALPARRDQLTARMPMGSVIKYVAAYERPFWREAGFSGEAFSDTGITVTTFDDSSHDGRQPALVTFSDGAAAREWSPRTPEERQQAVLNELVRFFGPQAAHPVGVRRKGLERRPLEPRLLRRRRRARHADRRSAKPCASPAVASTGPAPRPPPSGWAIWTGRSNPGSGPPRKWPRGSPSWQSDAGLSAGVFAANDSHGPRGLALLTFPPRLATSPRTRATSQSQRPHRFPTCKTRRAHG